MADSDSVPVFEGDSSGSNGKRHKSPWATNIKVLLALFLVFMFIVSDIFTDNIVSGFPSATKGRSPTLYGTVLQGIFLVIFYAIAVHLIERKVF